MASATVKPTTGEEKQIFAHIQQSRTTKVEGKSVWSHQMETMKMMDGGSSTKKDDLLLTDESEAMAAFAQIVEKSKVDTSVIPNKDFGASLQEIYRAFVFWSRKDGTEHFNVSNGFRRFVQYQKWMIDNKEYFDEPLTVTSIKQAAEMWPHKLTHDKHGRMCWWIDIYTIDIKRSKSELAPRDMLRFFAWVSHLVMLDRQAQENGMVFVESLGRVNFLDVIGLMPREIESKIKRLTMGVMPIRMKQCYLFHPPTWMKFLMLLMRPFISKKMRERFQLVPDTTDAQEMLDNLLGRDCIPDGFSGGLKGGTKDDIVFGQYIK